MVTVLPEEEDHDRLIELMLAQLERGRRSRPPWWRDADERDQAATQRDTQAAARDHAAEQRDLAADEADQQARDREHDAARSAVAAHARLDAAETEAAGALGEAAEAADETERTFAALRALPGAPQDRLARAFQLIELHLDHVYATLIQAGIDRDQARADLRNIGHHLAAAAAERQSAAQDRSAAGADRLAAKSERDQSATDRDQSAIHRAPRRQDA
jgi:hypothetical protein